MVSPLSVHPEELTIILFTLIPQNPLAQGHIQREAATRRRHRLHSSRLLTEPNRPHRQPRRRSLCGLLQFLGPSEAGLYRQKGEFQILHPP